jgi:hypothetical protein
VSRAATIGKSLARRVIRYEIAQRLLTGHFEEPKQRIAGNRLNVPKSSSDAWLAYVTWFSPATAQGSRLAPRWPSPGDDALT